MTTAKRIVSALTMAALAVGLTTANAQTVWNVNIGTEIDETDNFVGGATENTANSTWNSIPSANQTGMALDDSTGDNSAGVTLDFTGTRAGGGGVYGTYGTGLEIFRTYAGASSVSVDFTLKGLDNSATYDLIIYSDWQWANANYPVAQTKGTGMSGTIWINSTGYNSLVEDTEPANVSAQGNWFRITGLTPDGGELAFTGGSGNNAAFSGFQLIDPPPAAATPGTLIYGK